MTKDEALKLALEALETNNKAWKHLADSGDAGFWEAEDQNHYKQTEQAIAAVQRALANEALDKMAENARELGLDYEPAKEPCGGCKGSGWVPRDPDIGTDQECFVCGGSGVYPKEPEQEPKTKAGELRAMKTELWKQPEQEPVAWRAWVSKFPQGTGSDWVYVTKPIMKDSIHNQPLYTTPPQRKPLTPQEINQIEARWDASMHGSKIAFVVRETEAAHGIKGEA